MLDAVGQVDFFHAAKGELKYRPRRRDAGRRRKVFAAANLPQAFGGRRSGRL